MRPRNNKANRKPFTCPPPNEIDYKDVNLLRRFLSSYGKIVPRLRSGVSSKQQRAIASAIKRARIMALLPFEIK
ncbi:30S ribosomal protein S18 [Candidatus Uhrbacteria bacterium]|nr:30S ribosomal protein S18 [Candidatus Uhrbacteria bacterium]HJN84942.1 30S ribosomal protein S18 [Patescibacteria group bacterium]